MARRLQRALGVVRERHDSVSEWLERLTRGRQPHPTTDAIEQPGTGVPLELADLQTHGRRRHAEALGRAAEAAGPRDRLEDSELPEMERHVGMISLAYLISKY